MVARQRGAYAAAGALFEAGVTVSRAAGCLPAQANNLAGLADVHRELGQFGEGQARGEAGFACVSTAGWTRGMVDALRVLGDVHYQLGNFAAATQLLEASLARSRQLGGAMVDRLDHVLDSDCWPSKDASSRWPTSFSRRA
jgi:hypothetical protein